MVGSTEKLHQSYIYCITQYMRDLTGKEYGLLTVKKYSHRDSLSRNWWHCLCRCGATRVLMAQTLQRVKSCGCARAKHIGEAATTHGDSSSWRKVPEYNAWSSMIQRCKNPNNPGYHRYGSRGITVCVRWAKYENFLADMGRRPSTKHSLDRIDNNRGYDKRNCRWATRRTQANNRRDTVHVTFKGKTKTRRGWSEETGLSTKLISQRLLNGWSPERALTTPKRQP